MNNIGDEKVRSLFKEVVHCLKSILFKEITLKRSRDGIEHDMFVAALLNNTKHTLSEHFFHKVYSHHSNEIIYCSKKVYFWKCNTVFLIFFTRLLTSKKKIIANYD